MNKWFELTQEWQIEIQNKIDSITYAVNPYSLNPLKYYSPYIQYENEVEEAECNHKFWTLSFSDKVQKCIDCGVSQVIPDNICNSCTEWFKPDENYSPILNEDIARIKEEYHGVCEMCDGRGWSKHHGVSCEGCYGRGQIL